MKKLVLILLVLFLVAPAMAADTKVEDLDADATLGMDSVIYTVDDPSGTPTPKKVTVQEVADTVIGDLVAGDIPDLSSTYEVQLNNEAGLYGVLSDVTDFCQPGVAETISANWVNTANPWADNEVADNITITNASQIQDLNAGTDVTADLEEEAHASEHGVSAADTVFPADPGADRYLMWDDDPGELVWSEAAGGGVTELDSLTDVSGDGTAATYSLFDDNDGTFSFRAIADGDVPNDITIDLDAINVNAQTITDNSIVTIDDADAASGQLAKFTENGIEGTSSLNLAFRDTTPQVLLRDSNAAGADAADEDAAWIEAEMGTTTEDSEDADLIIYAVQGGTKTEIARFDESDDQWEAKKDLNLEEDLEVATGKHITVGANQWDNGSDKIDGAMIEDDGIDSAQYAAGSIDNEHLADDAVDSDELADGAVDPVHLANIVKSQFIPIGWFVFDGTTDPGDETEEDNIRYRDFASDATEEGEFGWQIPGNLTGSTIKVRAIAVITNATAPADTEGVSWGISAVSIASNESHDTALGTEVYSEDTDLDDSAGTQWDIVYFPYVEVTPTGLAAGEWLKMAVNRDHDNTDDTYGQDIGLIGVEIKWQEDPGTMTY